MPSSSFFVYILRCSDGSLYVGHTTDVEQRLKTHNDGKGASWTASRRPVTLLYSEPAADEPSAIRRELQIKRWTTAKKLALIAGNHQDLKALARCRAQHGLPMAVASQLLRLALAARR
ncbi:MAG TPA: GIY-YIG nuclease family protein [Tepidisphaeraceae bacterium]|jgi:predicted GIY-YIG superfamily endonuclease